MDNFRERQGLEESIRGAVTSFLELFPGDTVLSRGVHADASAASGSSGQQFPNRIAPSLLTANQTQIAHRLSAYLSHSIRDSDSLHRLFFRTYDNNTVGYNFQEDAVSAENVRLQNSLRECKKKEGEHLKVINALQDYLKNEVNRSADADKELRLKEDALVRVTAERNKFMKFINNIQTGSSQSFNSEREKLLKSTISTTAVASETAESYCGSFVRKKFGTSFYFGLIVSFRQPFFKVVYEDSDEEEMTLKDLSCSLWLSAVPSTKEAQCKRHATRLGLFNVINIDAGEVISESDKESLSENGNSSGSSSVSNSSNNSDISNNSSGSNNKNNSSSSSSSSAKALTLTKAQIQANLAKLKRLKSLDDYQNQTEPKRTCTIGTRYRGSRTNTKNPTEKELRDRGEVLYDWCSDYTDLSIAIRPKTQKSLNIQKSIKNSPNKNSPKNNCTNKNNGSSIDYAVIIDDDNSDIEKFPSNVISAIS